MRRVTALVAALLLTATPTTPIAAAEQGFPGIDFRLTPLEVEPGGVITASTAAPSCNATGFGPVTSPGFVAPIEWGKYPGGPTAQGEARGNTRVITTPGTYTATVRCLQKPDFAEVTFTILEPKPLRAFSLFPLELQPGAEITGTMPVDNDCTGTTITSPGFVAPLELQTEAGNVSELGGKTTVVSTPGTYQAVMTCRDGPFAVSFTVLGQPPAADPPTNDPPQTQPPIKKPKGAPETGGGGTAHDLGSAQDLGTA
ncbi:hypothetical protein [Saccharothrix variisporea]|uniref:Ig-like domain-containing protein n=1 Tax=Saccharothrix variisporea TaxID=543527 RepID=A0A495XGX9_9PSEU|nr:hypothetical protein [Saccharothrix variisporea]RKT72345.1 hypothetical protein DFJ66_5656 [Saccharothrix variisporea]